MSTYNYGLTVHQEALALLAAFSNPTSARQAIQQSIDARAEAEKAMATFLSAQDEATEKLKQAQAHRDATAKMLEELKDHRREITDRQEGWERNLNARETDLKRREDEHAAWWAKQQDEANAKTAALVNRSVDLDERAKSLKDAQAAVDALKANFEAKLAKIKAINE